ncbi:hypothetical protein D9611_014307 [Ephemerocybe angulata]|uniref:C2H2-type domain-containing protein n=1 Tax=Ephemerocybe angulata TaxID=980116 RepID=A0A8H5BU51_9AGAR|nr:hypothetical protein D9611_014307 [Tulosesus angulatus]
MRMSTLPTILSVAIYLSTYANAYRHDEVRKVVLLCIAYIDDSSLPPSHYYRGRAAHAQQTEVYVREPYDVNGFVARDLLSDLTTRELVDELKRRTDTFRCEYPNCSQVFSYGNANVMAQYEAHKTRVHGRKIVEYNGRK